MHKKILLGLDGSEGSFKALVEALQLAKLYLAELHTVSIEEVPRYAETVGEVEEEKAVANCKYKEAVHKAIEIAQKEKFELKPHIFVGHEVKTIIEFIKQNQFDLLVIGFMGRSAIYDRIMGSTCQNLVRLAPCSVVVVK
jgi:nucleotide-binding universal stress UspA family protein